MVDAVSNKYRDVSYLSPFLYVKKKISTVHFNDNLNLDNSKSYCSSHFLNHSKKTAIAMLKIAKLYLILFVVLALTCIRSIAHRACYTPDYKKGECISVNECEPLSKILNGPRDRKLNLFFRDSACGFANRTLQVCCEKKSDCKTPNGRPGICTSLFDCPSLFDKSLVHKTLEDHEIARLSGFRCENEKNYNFEFCCDDGKPFTEKSYTNLLASRSECGRENARLKFMEINDGKSNTYRYPWMVRVQFVNFKNSMTNKQIGSLINPRYVLTAAHYYAIDDMSPIAVIMEADDKNCQSNVCDNGFLKISIEKIIIHPGFDKTTSKNNIALIRMSKSVEYTDSVRPICLPQLNIMEDSMSSPPRVLTSGWSQNVDKTDGSFVDDKFQFKISTVPNDRCNEIYERASRRSIRVLPEHLCAEKFVSDSSCQLQSTPLMRPKNDQFELIGISLMGAKSCNRKDIPDVYLNTYLFIDWIKENIEP